MVLCAQQHRSSMMIMCTSRLWMRARAGALVLAAMREDVCADADAAALRSQETEVVPEDTGSVWSRARMSWCQEGAAG